MKIMLVLVLFFSVCLPSCAPTTPTVKEKTISPQLPSPDEALTVPVQLTDGLGEAKPGESKEDVPQYGELLSDVSISSPSLNPQRGEEVVIHFSLSKKAKSKITLYDPDFTEIRVLTSKGYLRAGRHSLAWDGRDSNGTVVPDEAYFFTITVDAADGNAETYDPTVFSGGLGSDITEANVDPVTKSITYRLPKMARVLIRLGVQDGPLLKTLVDWKPRTAGEITEHWNGKDRDSVIDLANHPRFKMLIAYFALPEHSIITYGNRTLDYRAYKKSSKLQKPTKDRLVRNDPAISPHYLLARTVDYSPTLKMTFSNVRQAQDTQALKDKTMVKIDIDELDKAFFVNQQYEITLFLDTEFYTEQELGYVPFNWVWDLSDVDEGEHVLTVNMSGFKDQIGVLSKKITVMK